MTRRARRLVAVSILVAALAAACGDDDGEPAASPETSAVDGAAPAPTTTVAPAATDDSPDPAPETPEPAGEPAPESETPAEGDGTTTDPVDPGFVADVDDPVYVDLVLDCLYGENEAGSCEQLEGSGLSIDDAYGLGNAYASAPVEFMRGDCLAGDTLACAELNQRVEAVAAQGEDEPRMLCFFLSTIYGPDPVITDLDAFHLGTLVGVDAPAGVLSALDTLSVDPTNQEGFDALDGYLGAVCAEAGFIG